MSRKGSDLPQQWHCTFCKMALEKTSPDPILVCPYCSMLQPGVNTREQARTDPQAYVKEPDICHQCGLELLPKAEGCIGCGAPRRQEVGQVEQYNVNPASGSYIQTESHLAARHQQEQQHNLSSQLSEQQTQMLQQPEMQQMFAQWFMQLFQQQQHHDAQQNETSNQKPQSTIQHSVIIRCECGAVFNPGARACATCGKPLPRNQPTGPPCFYCKKLLIKPDATICATCSRKQPEKATPVSKSPKIPESDAASLLDVSNQQKMSSSTPISSPPIAGVISSPYSPQPQYNFPQMFGSQFSLPWPRFPMSSPQSINQPRGGRPQYIHSGIAGPMSLPIQEQTPTSSNNIVADNVAPQMFPDVPATARPSKGAGVVDRDYNSVSSGHTLSTASQDPLSQSNIIKSSQDYAGNITTTTSLGSGTVTVTTVTKSPIIHTYAGAVKGHDRLEENNFTSQKDEYTSTAEQPYSMIGLKCSDPKKTMKITFHAIVPLAYWEWDDDSHIYVRFGHKTLGLWKEDCGNFQMRKIDDTYCEVSCTFDTFDGKLLDHNAAIPYKYVIYSPKMTEDDDCFEYLHAHQNEGDANRCLNLSMANLPDVYNKFDAIVYPKKTKVSPTLAERFTAVLKFWKRSSGDDHAEEFIPLDFLKMNSLCLNFYLEKYKGIICSGNFEQGLDIIEFANEISHIFESLNRFWIHTGVAKMVQVPNVNDFREEIKSWLTAMLVHIEENPFDDSGKQIVAAFFILLCLVKVYKMYQQLPKKFIVSLMKMLTFNRTMLVQSTCPDYDLLMSSIQKKPLKSVIEFLSHMYKRMAEMKYTDSESLLEWMSALPLYHFLDDRSYKPFGVFPVEATVTMTWVKDHYSQLGLNEMTVKAKDTKSFVVTYFDDMKPYIDLDPLLGPLFVYLTPNDDFPVLCERFQPSLTANKLQANVIKLDGVNKVKEKHSIVANNIHSVVNSVVHEKNATVLLSVVESSLLIFQHFSKLRSPSEHIVSLLSNTSTLILNAIAQLDIITDEESGWQWEGRQNTLDRIEKSLKSWIADKKVIGGHMLGSSVPAYGNQLATWKDRSKTELQIWNRLLSKDVASSRAVEDWNIIIRRLVCSRISFETPQLKIEIVCMLANFDDINPVLADLVMEAGYQAIDFLFDQPQYSKSTEFENLAAYESDKVGMLLGHVLTKKYPDARDIKRVSFSDLLEWNMWPIFITIFVSKPILRRGIPEEYHVAGICAQTCLEEICEKLKNGDVTVQDLQMVKDNQEQMMRLCLAFSSSDDSTTLYKSVERNVEKRLEECFAVNVRREVLSHLCHHIRCVNHEVKGLTDLEADLRKDFKRQAINTLCVRHPDDNIQIVCFKAAESLKFATDFHVVSGTKYGNELFNEFWRKAMCQASSTHPELTLDDIYSLVWQPCIQQCKQLLHSLMDLSMKLSDVDNILAPHEAHLETQLHSLLKGVSEIIQKSPNSSLIDTANKRIRNYWNLRRYQKGADIFLRLKKSLGLTGGDFHQVEKLSKQLSASVEHQTLQDVDDSLIDTGKFLQDIARDTRKVNCLEKFAKCQNIVKWLKEVTKDVNEIQNFVNVALATAAGGEGDLQHDRLSHLRIVGSGFASLIYNFPDDAGFFELKKACASVWEALDKNGNLPKLLEDCNNDIEWYQSVKDTQGSVEVTSYGQMRNILRYGYYQVGISSRSKSIHSIHDLISLKLMPGDKKLPKTSYNLDELRDLESKLVLITGSKAKNTLEVDHYLNILQHITRIAEVLLALQQAGNVTYSGWIVTLNCATYKVIGHGQKQELHLHEETAVQRVEQLRTCAKYMEDSLKEWENEVKESRSRHYELNYYTTLQLLKLRKELGLIQHNPGKSIDSEILALLESISPYVSSKSVQGIMTELQSKLIDLQATALIHEKYFAEEFKSGVPISENAPVGSAAHSNCINSTEGVADVLPSPSVSSLSSNKKEKENTNPQLKEQDLSDAQKDIFTDLVEYQGYSKLLVLKAMEESNASANQYDIQDWCDEHDGIFKFEEDYQEDEINISESSESSSDVADETEINVFNQGSNPSAVNHQSSPAAISPSVKIIHRQIIDESHPIVQQLVDEFEYDLDDSIEAVQLLGTLDRAMDYLARKEGENGSEEDTTPVVVIEPGATPEERENIVIFDDPNAEEKYLSLDQLGVVLGKLNQQLPEFVRHKRTFNEELKPGCPNLLIVSSCDILRAVLTLYMEDEALPLPTLEEVLICTTTTTAEEVNLLWQRAVGDHNYKRIFCLVHAEKLSYQICDEVVETLKQLSQGKQEYRLVILCSKSMAGNKPHIVSKLLLYEKSIIIKPQVMSYQKYLKDHFTGVAHSLSSQEITLKASIVDHENSCVRVVSSKRTGMGKSLFIQRMAEKLCKISSDVDPVHYEAVIPIHGPVVTPDIVMQFLKKHYENDKCKLYHFDIAPNILSEVDTILFSLLILQGLRDSQGCVWRCHPSQLYTIEVTLPKKIKDNPESRTIDLLGLLPTVECLSPNQVVKPATLKPSQIGMDNNEFSNSTFQRVYQYLRRHDDGQRLDRFRYQDNVEGTHADCLQHFLKHCGVQDPSWSEINHFTKFLNLQLESCEKSVFCDEALVGDVMSGLKGFVVKFMIRMSRDFATPSLQCEVTRIDLNDQSLHNEKSLQQYSIEERRKWEESSHPYIFFNNDGISITFVGFIITSSGDLVDPRRALLEARIMTPQLYKGLVRQKVNFADDYQTWKKSAMIEKLCMVMGIDFDPENVYDPDETYVLTVDNLIKILAIQMRFRCGIPVVIMGETGCGKTRLIRYMCDLARIKRQGRNMLILKVHGGIKEKDIIDFMTMAEHVAKENKEKNMETVVFFDEANTTDAIGLIKEIMCDRRIHGRLISDSLKFIAACNPYRRHSNEMIARLKDAGLGFYVEASNTPLKLGHIPLRELVYRVFDLPPSMRPLVYDFGQLKKRTEDEYIKQIVSDHVKNHSILSKESPNIVSVITKVLATSQAYMRERKDECSFVSLRDVERAMIVFEYFCEKMPNFRRADRQEMDDQVQHPSDITSALVLALSVCYQSRLQQRNEYERIISSTFESPLDLPGKTAQLRNEITWCQNVLLDNMVLGPNIAKNAALRENVFMMAICIELRIPLFLVGKPGSSKSLAKSIIQDSMHGKTSRSELLRIFKQVHMFSYQCSQLATSESVIEVFSSAQKFQSKQDITQYVSVVVLDEVGLAEDSPNLPLKALHPLLEDGTEGAGAEGKDEIVAREERVAFIGISNWALDPAKMNRGVMVTRGIPDIGELEFSARGICGKEDNDHIKKKLDPYFTPLAQAYQDICGKQDREFFGLRDFYSLIKMLYWMCKESRGLPLTWPQMKHAIMRNFGGLKTEKLNPFEEFRVHLNMPDKAPNPDDYQDVERIWPIINPDNSRLGLIKTSLGTRETSFHGESRYLLFLTENYAALDILERYIRGKDRGGAKLSADTNKPFTIFGSSFPKDKEYTQICRNINQIKICMETGRTVILLNLENLYESLYDVLNQYYMHYGDSRYVDLGLQTHRVKCRVHNDFKLILIAERDTVYDTFPTPLINRLEKHFVLTSSILEQWQEEVLRHFQLWISQFSQVLDVNGIDNKREFKESNAFIGYQEDTPAAVVFQASQQLKQLSQGNNQRRDLLQGSGIISPKDLTIEQEGSEDWKKAVLRLSQYLLLQMASDDSIVRLKNTALANHQEELMELYLSEEHHNSINNFIRYHMHNNSSSHEGLLLQVTTHGHLLLREELEDIIDMKVESFLLQEFDTELDFSNKVGPIFQRDDKDDYLLVIQCDSGHMNGDLIACARYRIYDERVKALVKEERGATHVLFIINLPHQVLASSRFVGFQGDPWISAHIDDLRPTSGDTIDPLNAISATISELFIGGFFHDIAQLLGETVEQVHVSGIMKFTFPCVTSLSKQEQNMTDEKQESVSNNNEDCDGENEIEPGMHADLPSEESDSEESQRDQKPLSTEQLIACEQEIIEQIEDIPILNPIEISKMASKPTEEMVVVDIEGDDTEFAATGVLEEDNLIQSAGLTSLGTLDEVMESQQQYNGDQVVPLLPEVSKEESGKTLLPQLSVPTSVTKTEETSRHFTEKQKVYSGQCRRLHNCIQAAASKVEDSTKDRSTQRVARLTKLIERCPDHLDCSSFHGILVMHIYRLLREREADRIDLTDWILREALNASKLEVGGTFRNVLARKIDEVVITIFANIIPRIDRGYNLDLINPKVPCSTLSQFWLAMFKDPKIQQFRYSDMIEKGSVPGLGQRKLGQDFKCKLPFFWLVKDAVDSQWDNAKCQAGANMKAHHEQLCILIRDTPVGEVLQSVHTDNCEELYMLYLQDYVKSVHNCKHKSAANNDTELRIVSDALDHIVHCSQFQHHTLTSMVAALHLAYEMNKSQILFFNQLVSHSPSIMYSLERMFPPKELPEMELHIYAAEKVIEKLEPPLQKDNPNPNLAQWLNHMRLSQNTIVSILSLKSHSERAIKARHCWWRLRATQLFVELVMLKHPEVDLKLLARRLCARWKGGCDFLKVSTINAVQLQLSSIEKLLKKDCHDKNKIKEVKRSCRGFFMEMVSDLCFKGEAAPEPELIRMLLDIVFTEKDQNLPHTQDLTPYKDDKVDKIPTVRFFLLQLLLEHSMDQVRDHLRDYLDRCYRVLVMGSQAGAPDHDLYLLIIQCFEDALCKKFSTQHFNNMANIEEVTTILIEGYNGLHERRRGTPTLEYLEGVAKVRHSLSVIVNILRSEQNGIYMELLRAAKRLCSDRDVNSIDPTGEKDTMGPVIYLLKLVVRQYGMPCLKAIAENHDWLIPAELKSDREKLVDPFVIYEDIYKSLREAINGAMYGNQMEELDKATQDLKFSEVVYLLLALYEKTTLSRTTGNPADTISGDALERLNEFLMNYQLLSNEQQLMARALLANQQGGRILEQMHVSPQQPLQCRTILGVVVHSVAVFFCRQKVDILLPFVNMLKNPSALKDSYLPTMQEDPLIESLQMAMKEKDSYGRFYVCANGHRYFIGNCGRPWVEKKCNVCKAPIGGRSHELAAGEELGTIQDTTKKGHDLGAPLNRTHPTPERNLSARAVCILRALMHSAFVWACCNNDPAIEAISSLVIPYVPPQQLPEFFWAHLEKDLELLGQDTGKGLDETAMIMHLVLRQIVVTNPPIGGTVQTMSSLEDKVARKEWEKQFNQHYIHPVLSSLDDNLAIAMDRVASDEQQDHDQLFYLVYEKAKYKEESLEPHLWTYRSRITLEHLRQTLQEDKMKERYPILYEFLQVETELRATRYLPDIARLQQCLYDKFNRQIDRKDVKKQTIQGFIKELPNKMIQKEYQEMIESVKAAWALVGHKLKNHGRLPVEEKFYIAVINDNTAMEYLVPTTSEAGVCTTALVDFLTLTHNNFIERCRALVAQNDQSSLSFWREHKVPITHLHGCHLLDYELQLPSIILSHCHYSLKVGKGQDVKYDHQALEKHILNRFIHGKPLILPDIPHVVYRKDIYTTVTFADVRKKVEPQEKLEEKVRQDIIAELHTPDRLREALDVVEIVLGFLSSGGGKADKHLGEYIDKTLKMKKRRFSQKAKSFCQLKHVLSLWETIAVELARQLCLRGQEPFDSIRQEFLCVLSRDEDGEDQHDALDRCLGQFDPDLLLGTLYEFIETYIKHCPLQENDQSLVEVLELVLDRYGTELPLLKVFPASIKLNQAVAAWKHIVHYYAKKH